jgi:hypothetical protein
MCGIGGIIGYRILLYRFALLICDFYSCLKKPPSAILRAYF